MAQQECGMLRQNSRRLFWVRIFSYNVDACIMLDQGPTYFIFVYARVALCGEDKLEMRLACGYHAKIMTKLTYRRWQILLTFVSFFVFASSLYLQYMKGLQPCPLCLMQRFCVLILFMICFIGVTVNRRTAGKIVAGGQFFVAACGLFFAGRQLWLQALPVGHAPSCMPELDVLIRYFPWRDVLRSLLWGTGNCAEISWRWLGLSMPAWSALYFLFLLIAAIYVFWGLKQPVTGTRL